MKERRNILIKGYIVSILVLVLGGSVLFQLFKTQFYQSEKYKIFAKSISIRESVVKAKRGNLYTEDKNLLATSVVKYNIHVDMVTVDQELFNKEIKGLSDSLSKLLGKPSSYYFENLTKARKSGNQYLLLARKLSHDQFASLKKFPILRKGKFKGGLIVDRETVRVNTIEDVGRRTIGFDDHRGKAGLEGAYSIHLKGKDGKRKEQRITAKDWKPIDSWNQTEPDDGADVYTTIDLNIQNWTYNALLKQLKNFDADHGCAVVMEVQTGKIKSLVNLQKVDSTYNDIRNFAVWERNEPGSTFKPISLLAAMHDEYINQNSVINIQGGYMQINGEKIRDDHAGKDDLTIKDIIAQSSNVGTVKAIYSNYKKRPEKFVKKLENWHLTKPLGVDIPGESSPNIPHPKQDTWSPISLPWMAYGYGLELTPLQILTFYNAIANNGKMLKPLFIDKIVKNGAVLNDFTPTVLNPKMASDENILEMQEMLEAVFEKSGTAEKLKSDNFKMAGKTGTTQANYWKKNKKREYRASFAGYFPADKPKYSCIVVIHKPDTEKSYYGAKVAGPVFKEVSENIMNSTPIEILAKNDSLSKGWEPNKESGFSNDFNQNVMPSTLGKNGFEVVSSLENLGLKVIYKGTGRVKKQSIPTGRKIKKGDLVYLQLQ